MGEELSVENAAKDLKCDPSQVVEALSSALQCRHLTAWRDGQELGKDAVGILRDA